MQYDQQLLSVITSVYLSKVSGFYPYTLHASIEVTLVKCMYLGYVFLRRVSASF